MLAVNSQRIENELKTIKLDSPQFFKRCLGRVLARSWYREGARLAEIFKAIRSQSGKDYKEERELVYELYLKSPPSDEQIVYLYFITLAEDPIQEFIESQNLKMHSLALLIEKELSNAKK